MTESSAKLRRRAAVINGYKQGMTIKDLEKKYGISAATIKTYLRNERTRAAQEEQETVLAERNKAIRKDMESGLSVQETAEKEGVSCHIVYDTLRAYRTSVVSPEILFSEIGMIGRRKGTVKRWAEKQIGNTVRTPQGEMLVTAVYPHFFECCRKTGNHYIQATYTHGELYYINQINQEVTYAKQEAL